MLWCDMSKLYSKKGVKFVIIISKERQTDKEDNLEMTSTYKGYKKERSGNENRKGEKERWEKGDCLYSQHSNAMGQANRHYIIIKQ